MLVMYATFVCHCVPSELVSTLPALTHLAYHPFAFDGHVCQGHSVPFHDIDSQVRNSSLGISEKGNIALGNPV